MGYVVTPGMFERQGSVWASRARQVENFGVFQLQNSAMLVSKSVGTLGLRVVLVVVVVLITPVQGPRSAPIANCLQQTNGTYNIGCPNHPSQMPECFLDGPNGTSPYIRLCDGQPDCNVNNPVDEGNRGGVNDLLDCKWSIENKVNNMPSRTG